MAAGALLAVNGHMIYCARKVSHNGETKTLASIGSDSDRRASAGSGTSRDGSRE